MAVDNIIIANRGAILDIAASYGATNIRVFGSRARGDARPDSDVDLLIALEPHRSLLDLVAIKQDIEDILGCHVDVVTESSISPYMRDEVLHEAVAL
jgi:predicted nucleotidyltransferase